MMPLSLYIHFPWCAKKCPYCDFNSHEIKGDIPEGQYIDALLSDLDQDLITIKNQPLVSIFMGGGTPSLFSPEAIHRLLGGIRSRLDFADDIEITMEVNPATVQKGLVGDRERFAGYYAAGITRLSIGVQSLNDTHLNLLGRVHSGSDAINAITAAKQAGFTNFNIDLMHGLSEQNLQNALADLKAAIALEPTHISWYQLTIEPNTVFYNRPPTLPDDDTLWEIYQTGLNQLASQGFHRYEISAFSRPGKQSVHNQNYWQFGDYIGIGAGAHGKYTHNSVVTRRAKTRQPEHYLASSRQAGGANFKDTIVDQGELPIEFLMNALRLTDGFNQALYEMRTGLPLSTLQAFLNRTQPLGLIEERNGWIKPTNKGAQFLNSMLEMV
jgi:putative oxygen-independent coproporphyrinogen III oxidase